MLILCPETDNPGKFRCCCGTETSDDQGTFKCWFATEVSDEGMSDPETGTLAQDNSRKLNQEPGTKELEAQKEVVQKQETLELGTWKPGTQELTLEPDGKNQSTWEPEIKEEGTQKGHEKPIPTSLKQVQEELQNILVILENK